MNTTYFYSLREVTAVRRIDTGLELEFEQHRTERLRIEAISAEVVRLRISRSGAFDEVTTFAVRPDYQPVATAFDVTDSDGEVSIRTSAMSVTVSKQNFSIAAHRADGSIIFESGHGEDGECSAFAVLNDEYLVRRRCGRDDAFYGLGEKSGSFNRRGRDFTLWNTDVLNPNVNGRYLETDGVSRKGDPTSVDYDPYYISIPFFYHMPRLSDAMAGFFFDNAHPGRFEFTSDDEYLVHFKGGAYTEYVFAGPAMSDILEDYTDLTGRIPRPPLWALGHHQCRWFSYTQGAVEQLADKHRELEIPCDVLWLDIDYMDGYRVFTWDAERFPDPMGMLSRLRDRGFRAVTIIDPGVKCEPGYSVFDEAVKRDVLCKTEGGAIYLGQVWPGKTAFPDFVTDEARQWWGELNAAHVQSGLAGIWNDMNEPATGDIPPDAMRFGNGKYAHDRFHNEYALLMAMGTVDGLLSAMPEKRTFVLSRAGSAGIQRYAANWMGDNSSRWDHLWLSIPMALGLGISGQPFVGADIGGFMGEPTAELLVRWYQCGALTPFCRNHNSANQADQYPWVFGRAVQDFCRSALELRYQLLPYLYSAFVQASETGSPVQKPLIFDYQDDSAVRNIDDEYLLGDSLLVAPVYEKGCTARQTYFPAGTWYHWHTGEKISGRLLANVPTPMNYIPLYARGGAAIPLWRQALQTTMDFYPDEIELRIFLPDEDGDTESVLHEDDGLTFAFRNGAFRRTVLTVSRRGRRLKIVAKDDGDGFPEFCRRGFAVRIVGASFRSLAMNGEAVEAEAELIAPSMFVLEGELEA